MGLDLDKLKGILAEVKGDLTAPDTVEDNIEAIAEAAEDIEEIFADGFQWSDVGGVLGAVVPALMDVAGELEGKTGKEKRAFVVDAIWTLYKVFDPNIPWIPEPFETAIEKAAVNKLAEAAVEAVYRYGVKKGLITE